jgi:hypothetical protein
VIRLLVGLLKGAVIGGGVGYGAYALEQSTGFGNSWLTFGVVGALVGLFVGKPLWTLLRDKNTTNIIAILKAVFGFGVGCGLYALFAKAWGPANITLFDPFTLYSAPVLGAGIGGLYGAFVELDDSIGDDGKSAKKDAELSDTAAAKQLPKKTK